MIWKFEFDGRTLAYVTGPSASAERRLVEEIAAVTKEYRRRRGCGGYLIAFHDRSRVTLNRYMLNADDLYEALSPVVPAS